MGLVTLALGGHSPGLLLQTRGRRRAFFHQRRVLLRGAVQFGDRVAHPGDDVVHGRHDLTDHLTASWMRPVCCRLEGLLFGAQGQVGVAGGDFGRSGVDRV